MYIVASLGHVRLGWYWYWVTEERVNSIFLKDGKIPLINYETKLVSLTNDGASVNTGRISGLMTRSTLERLVDSNSLFQL